MLLYKDGAIEEHEKFFPNISFPAAGPTDDFLAQHNAYKVNSFKPHDRATEKLTGCEPYIEDGWAYIVEVVPKTDRDFAAERAKKEAEIRSHRTMLLKESDWTQGKDIPDEISQPWAAYRQALRDITEQEGFPDSVTWPLVPGTTEDPMPM